MEKTDEIYHAVISINSEVFANPPACPLFNSKMDCLASVEKTYQESLDYLLQEFDGNKDPMIDAARTIRNYEVISCEKTC